MRSTLCSWILAGLMMSPVSSALEPSQQRSVLKLQEGRFHLEVDWRDGEGETGDGQTALALPPETRLSGGSIPLVSRDSAVVEFFGGSNWEVLVKVLDGRGHNDHFWVFLAAATDVSFTTVVTDTSCGHVKTYVSPLGIATPAVTDTTAFSGCAAPLPPSCESRNGVLCLGKGGRFRVAINWFDFRGDTGVGRQVRLPGPGLARSADSGLFYFFSARNWEMLVKVLDGCGINNHYWVFSAATTDVEYTLKITDTVTGKVKTYENPGGFAAAAVNDTRAFATCGRD